MGQVFRAYDSSTDRIVALKVLPAHLAEDEEFQQRFRREARIAASLNDPHLVPIHSYGEIDGRLYVDMRLIEGRDLLQYISENGGRLSPERAVAIVEQVAAALDTAHEVGLIHRDVKPSNILVSSRDFVYLIDFGLARTAADTALTRTGHTMGTMAYMAPERFRGMTDHRADIYALACVLYECLTGHLPYPGDTFEDQLNAHLNTPPPQASFTAPGVPPTLDAVVARGMAKDVNYRYQTAIEFAEAAKAALAGHRVAMPSPPPPPYPATAATPQLPPQAAATPPPADTPQQPQQQKSNRALIVGIVAASLFTLAMVTILVIALVTNDQAAENNTASSVAPHPRTPKQGPAMGGLGAPATTATPNGATAPPLPAFAPPPDLGANCQYVPVAADSPDASPKPVDPPPSGRVSTSPAQLSVTISTNFGDIGIALDNAKSPCTVNSFTSLTRQQFFNNTPCPRLTKAADSAVLLCGGPDKDGGGGPGYEFADEYPVNQYPPNDPALRATVVYPRGTVAMASSDPNTNGSQFIMFFQDTETTPVSTVLGSIDEAGLAVLDKIGAAGVAGNRETGLPTSPVTINSVQLS
ncbi:protein kinase [Mycobacterium sp. Aquia_216]|uniref:protein kinase domain-containing protein n=1 Tax=Mycobacterium sp. Aquia_216 TaxID=2991729 RepID=UPI00227CA63F|nr:protein kinase [Mycobacterium sp. Aquia_216]WAJ47665.1 protein kinase [Mycobacterium sp. Aquia_216]